jgi:hypothetical protein
MPDGGVFEVQRLHQNGDRERRGKVQLHPSGTNQNPLHQVKKEGKENRFAVFEISHQIFQEPLEKSSEKMEARTFVLESV